MSSKGNLDSSKEKRRKTINGATVDSDRQLQRSASSYPFAMFICIATTCNHSAVAAGRTAVC